MRLCVPIRARVLAAGPQPANFESMNKDDIPIRKLRLGDAEPEDLSDATPAERMRMVWVLTLQAWAFKEGQTDEPRLPRHVVRVVRRGS